MAAIKYALICDSGKKYKKCCGSSLQPQSRPQQFTHGEISDDARETLERHAANELIREQQQGLGKPIISIKSHGHQLVAVGNTLHYSPKWKTFPDFLSDYLKNITTGNWGNAELKKPFEERHPVLQWYDNYCRYQQAHQVAKQEIFSGPATGVVMCYLGLAYNLYLLNHNVDLQKRFIERIKNVDQFQGAYYELIVANTLIRAGFTLELEDETDDSAKHCEFSATSQITGKKYWVEAKMRGVEGVLGKNRNSGVPQSKKDVTSNLTKQLNLALEKPAENERLVFIDVNAPSKNDGKIPDWINKAIRRLDDKEKNLKGGEQAYIFVTNVPFHYHLEHAPVESAFYAHGLGMSDFSKPGMKRLSQMYREKKKHIDAHNIAEFFKKYPHIPQNFDGSLSPATLSQRLVIGEYYFFEDIGENGVVGRVITATVSEAEKKIYIAIQTQDGTSQIFTKPMSQEELEDYSNHPEAFFGKIQNVGKQADNPYELFEFFVSSYKETPRSRMLEFFQNASDIEYLKSLDDESLLLECCERWVGGAVNKE